MTAKQKRLALILGGLSIIAVAVALVLTAFNQNLVFFFTPSQITSKEAPTGRTFRSSRQTHGGRGRRRVVHGFLGFGVMRFRRWSQGAEVRRIVLAGPNTLSRGWCRPTDCAAGAARR